MSDENNNEKEESHTPNVPPIPPELEKELVKALQGLCFWMHEQSGASHIILDIKHVSDALTRSSQTLIGGAGCGLNLKAQPQGEPEKVDASKMAEEAIERAIAQAKKKNEEGK